MRHDAVRSTPMLPDGVIPAAYRGVDGAAYRVRVPVREIQLTRKEGHPDEMATRAFTSGHDANFHLALQGKRIRGTGYEKFDFSVTWADGQTYQGRYDLEASNDRPSLQGHIQAHLKWLMDESNPLTTPSVLSDAEILFATYDVGQYTPAAAPDGWPVVRDYKTTPHALGEPNVDQIVYGLAV